MIERGDLESDPGMSCSFSCHSLLFAPSLHRLHHLRRHHQPRQVDELMNSGPLST